MNQATKEVGDRLNFDELLLLLRKSKVILFGVMLACLAIGGAAAFLIRPTFRSEVTMASVTSDGASGALRGLSGQLGGLASFVGADVKSDRSEGLGVLRSRALINRYVEEQKLLPVLFEKDWDQVKKDWRPDTGKKPTAWDAFQLFSEDIRQVREDKKSGLLVLSIEWHDPVLAAKWANDLVARANEMIRTQAIEDANRNIAYLKSELEKTSIVELQLAIYRLIEVEIKSAMVAQTKRDYAFRVIDPAVPAEKKVKPKRSIIIIFSFFAGLFIAVSIIVLRGRPSGQ